MTQAERAELLSSERRRVGAAGSAVEAVFVCHCNHLLGHHHQDGRCMFPHCGCQRSNHITRVNERGYDEV